MGLPRFRCKYRNITTVRAHLNNHLFIPLLLPLQVAFFLFIVFATNDCISCCSLVNTSAQFNLSSLVQTAASRNSSILMERLPMPIHIDGIPFSRPMIPFTCGGKYGGVKGCGRGNLTRRESCASLLQKHTNSSFE